MVPVTCSDLLDISLTLPMGRTVVRIMGDTTEAVREPIMLVPGRGQLARAQDPPCHVSFHVPRAQRWGRRFFDARWRTQLLGFHDDTLDELACLVACSF